MASTGTGSGSALLPDFYLTPQQQNLLFTALNANKHQQVNMKTELSLSPSSFKASPLQDLNDAEFPESPFLDKYDYDFGDSSFGFSFNDNAAQAHKMIEDIIPGDGSASSNSDSTEGDTSEKRSHPDDEDDDASFGNESKRREGNDKAPKKPGRKPLTSEPTSKRKAQNRAAQRAFRERKEKHLKDLETKVEELEKASENANHENNLLRAQVERISAELNQYKQKMTLVTSKTATPSRVQAFGSAAVSNLNNVDFQFDFPKFGSLPEPTANRLQKSSSQPMDPNSSQSASPNAIKGNQNDATVSPISPQAARNAQFKEDLAKFNGIHTPSMSSSNGKGSRISIDSANYSLNGAMSSPSASSHSHVGASSSCGTSPEPSTQSPTSFKPVDALTTIGEEQPSSISMAEQPFSRFPNHDFNNNNNNGFDWLVQQNNGQFDPQLFGDYREPQESIMTNPTFDDLFSSLEADFSTPYNIASGSSQPKKTNLIDEIDAKQNAMDDEPLHKPQNNMSCNQLWERLQACPKAQTGDFDLDGLCSELTKKAKCSGSGPVVAERDFDSILKKYMGKEVSSACIANKLGISVDKAEASSMTMP